MSNVLVHQSLGGIDLDTVWRVVEAKLDSLSTARGRIGVGLDKRSP